MENRKDVESILWTLFGKEFVSLTFRNVIQEKDFQRKTYYIIGNDYEAEIGVEKSSGEVYSLLENDIVFINSSLTELIDFIDTFSRKIDFNKEYVEATRKKDTRELSKQFKSMDKKAMEKGTWWSFILEQTEDGIL
jgi:hypothetical protein